MILGKAYRKYKQVSIRPGAFNFLRLQRLKAPDHWHAPARFDVRRSGKVPAIRSVSQTEKPD